MRTSLFQRLLLSAVPALVLVAVVVSSIWGQHGLLRRRELRAERYQGNQRLAAIQRENDALLREIKAMERDPVVMERIIARELGWARPGTTLYRRSPGPQ